MKINLLRTARLLALAALPLFLASQVHAQATRTWVSGVGDDANPCSRTAPCKTFAGAISKTAAGGEIDALDPGGFGGVTITKAITLAGDGTLASILVQGTNAITVNAGVNDVVIIRNLSLVGIGGINGIYFIQGGELHVDGVTINGFNGQGILFQPTNDAALFVANTIIKNNFNAGMLLQPTASGSIFATVSNVTLDSNNGYGLRAEAGVSAVVRNSHAGGSALSGFHSVGGSRPAFIVLENCVAAGNASGIVAEGASGSVRISNSTATRNAVGLSSVSGGAIISFGNNRVNGNNAADGAPTTTVGQM
jgi:Right handed beta helix region